MVARWSRWTVGVAMGALAATAAQAGDKPLYQPVPAWVVPAPAIDPAKLGDDAPLFVTLDSQDRFDGDTVWAYHDVATRMATPEVVQQAGTVSLAWQPAKGDLVIHKVEIIRGAQHIDALAKGTGFQVIRREQQLERFAIDGELTATMAVEGLQVGDVLHVVASVSRREQALGGQVEDMLLLPTDPIRAGFARSRLLWPASLPLKTRVLADGAGAVTSTRGDTRELVIEGVLPKAAELPADAPAEVHKLPILQASSFADWPAVSKVMAPFYATDGAIKPGSDLDKQVAAIKAAQPDQLHRLDAALELVQDKVRYLYNGLDKGNYVPQPAEQTWSMRYGDCKAKTLLLLSVLHGLGIEAEPVLANATLGALVSANLPSAGAFNHVFVHAKVDGHDYWLDGTTSGSRYASLGDVPPFRWVLPLRDGGAGLLELPMRAPVEPTSIATIDLDQRAGVSFPTLATVTLTTRGPTAAVMGLVKTQGSKEQKDQAIQRLAASLIGGAAVPTGYTIDYDPVAGTAKVIVRATATGLWTRENQRWRLPLDRTVAQLSFDPDRSRAAWQSIPAATGLPDRVDMTTAVRLPAGLHASTEGDRSFAAPLAGASIARTVSDAGGAITVRDQVAGDGAEIAPADIPAMRARVALAKTRLFTVVAPADLPPHWQQARDGRADGRFKPVIAAYSAAIADDPKAVDGYENRAGFLQSIYDYKAALPDLDKAVSLAPTAAHYRWRAQIERVAGQDPKALADLKAAAALEPNSPATVQGLGNYLATHGQDDAAVALAQQQIDAGGTGKPQMMAEAADFLARGGQKDRAVTMLDQAVAAKPGDPSLLNERCWIKAQLAVQLDTALKDCTKSIELSDQTVAALDSRALVYFRLNRFDDALADLAAALDQEPDLASSLYLRGIIFRRQGKADEGARDLAAALMISPLIADDYRPFGIAP